MRPERQGVKQEIICRSIFWADRRANAKVPRLNAPDMSKRWKRVGDKAKKVDTGQVTQHPTGNGNKLRGLIAMGSYCRDLGRETT